MKNQPKIAVGLNPQSQIHYTDHLAVICILMDISLIFIDPLDHELGMRYYPGLKSTLVDYQEMSPEHLITNYDILFMSDLWDKHTFHEKFEPLELRYNKI